MINFISFDTSIIRLQLLHLSSHWWGVKPDHSMPVRVSPWSSTCCLGFQWYTSAGSSASRFCCPWDRSLARVRNTHPRSCGSQRPSCSPRCRTAQSTRTVSRQLWRVLECLRTGRRRFCEEKRVVFFVEGGEDFSWSSILSCLTFFFQY